MAIVDYEVVIPPTSGELEAQVLASLQMEQTEARGLVHLTIRSEQRVPSPSDESVVLRIRSQEMAENGHLTRILGRASMHDGAEVIESDSAVISFASSPDEPARARFVKL